MQSEIERCRKWGNFFSFLGVASGIGALAAPDVVMGFLVTVVLAADGAAAETVAGALLGDAAFALTGSGASASPKSGSEPSKASAASDAGSLTGISTGVGCAGFG